MIPREKVEEYKRVVTKVADALEELTIATEEIYGEGDRLRKGIIIPIHSEGLDYHEYSLKMLPELEEVNRD